ncbi:ATP-binding protein [Bacteroides cellulosilyticus]|uniref:ATP-binding protein n=1 Tax=Bacteroides cellulosilyticus TaxID=246787 RepID=UPI001C37D275|nr:ATP-binding protein [Bacteroides cellulosilyticus]MBV3637660.1 ATP-binding protein [Bacteroides cellulosilyticus]MBV3663962.1 ATP-binding protein [Bacteroides cellulosilyticus]MBV3685903.1 ATP-binding protein [Bacteroides cellulosilyticus]MBV3694945.1 ATP-binding protein [Bacteroides cellulosilyticus]MBV3708200.1 ATP-binding protein [Bacteroides cellulosilyticus]
MKQLLKDIIIDQKSFLPSKKTIIRSFPEKYLNNEEIIIISGVRRCGKSVLLQQIRDRLPQKDYFFNFDDDRLGNFTVENFQQLYEVFIELYGEQNYFYFDEIQNIAGWEHFAKRLYNSGKKVFITGSNARMLSKELGTYLTGCYIAIELYPFSFSEFLDFREQQHLLGDISGTIARGEIQSAFNDYLKQGGFPIYLKSEDGIVLKTLYDNILYKDVMVRNQIVNEREVKELVYYTVSNIGKPLTYTSLAKVIGVKNPTTVKNYLEYIENTYLLFSLSKLDYSVKAQLRNPKKVYAIDNALVSRLGFHFSGEEGRLLENMVYIELRRRGGEVFYHNSGSAECDFVVRDGFRVMQAIQVCYLLDSSDTREREIRGVQDAMDTYQLLEGTIVTNTHEEEVKCGDKIIHILPAWKWLRL